MSNGSTRRSSCSNRRAPEAVSSAQNALLTFGCVTRTASAARAKLRTSSRANGEIEQAQVVHAETNRRDNKHCIVRHVTGSDNAPVSDSDTPASPRPAGSGSIEETHTRHAIDLFCSSSRVDTVSVRSTETLARRDSAWGCDASTQRRHPPESWSCPLVGRFLRQEEVLADAVVETAAQAGTAPWALLTAPSLHRCARRAVAQRVVVRPLVEVPASSSSWATTSAGCSRVIYHRGLMVGETPNIDRIGAEGAMFTDYYAEQSCTAGRNAFFTGMHPLRTGMILPQLPGSPSYLRPGTPVARQVPARSRLHAPASSARTILATTRTRCRPRTASRSSGAISTTSTRCRG